VRVDISTTLGRKIAALQAHASQIKERDKLAERMTSWAAEEGEPIGVAAGEALRLIVIDDDEDEGPSAASSTEATTGSASAVPASAEEPAPA
jgi:hypothetical protein